VGLSLLPAIEQFATLDGWLCRCLLWTTIQRSGRWSANSFVPRASMWLDMPVTRTKPYLLFSGSDPPACCSTCSYQAGMASTSPTDSPPLTGLQQSF